MTAMNAAPRVAAVGRTDREWQRTLSGAPAAVRLALLLLLACDDPSLPERGPLPRIDPVERARVDGEEHALTSITRVALRADELLAVAHRLSESVVFFNRAGEQVGEFGRGGEGPGEFRTINEIGWTGDTLWVTDVTAGRLTRISGLPFDGRISDEVPISGLRPSQPVRLDGRNIPSYRVVIVRAVYPGGDLLVEMALPQVPDASEFANTALYARLAEDGSIKKVLSHVDRPPEEVRVIWTSDTRLSFGIPWVLEPSVAVSGDGRRIAVVKPTVQEEGATGMFEVTMLDASGDTLYRRRHPFDAISIPKAVADSAIDARTRSIAVHDDNYSADLVDTYRREVVIPPIFPPFGLAFIGSDDRLWIQQLERGVAGARPYLVLNDEGDLVGEVPFTAGVQAVGANSVWVAVADSFGVPSLVIFDLPWSRNGEL